jgi:hypothetical protein
MMKKAESIFDQWAWCWLTQRAQVTFAAEVSGVSQYYLSDITKRQGLVLYEENETPINNTSHTTSRHPPPLA